MPTASSITVLPQALGLIADRTSKQSILNAFAAAQPGDPDVDSEGQVLVPDRPGVHLGRRDGVAQFAEPGHRRFPHSGAGQQRDAHCWPHGQTLRDANAGAGATLSVGGNPWMRQRNVQPSEYEQDQINFKIDAQLTDNNRLSGTFFYSDFPALDSFPDPSAWCRLIRSAARTRRGSLRCPTPRSGRRR